VALVIVNRLVTTKQKKFLEKTFNALGISIEDFMEINNLIEFKEETEKEITILKNENKFLAEVNTNQNKVIQDLIGMIEELNKRIDDLLYMRDIEAQ
jgi:hypothetical protein